MLGIGCATDGFLGFDNKKKKQPKQWRVYYRKDEQIVFDIELKGVDIEGVHVEPYEKIAHVCRGKLLRVRRDGRCECFCLGGCPWVGLRVGVCVLTVARYVNVCDVMCVCVCYGSTGRGTRTGRVCVSRA